MKKIQEFRPPDLGRILEGADCVRLGEIGSMAADSLERLATIPQGQARDEAITDAIQTVEDVVRAKRGGAT